MVVVYAKIQSSLKIRFALYDVVWYDEDYLAEMGHIKYSVVIPVYNEASILKFLFARLWAVFKGLNQEFEIIFVDDGSVDNSYDILKRLCGEDSCIKVIRFTRNFGQHQALMAGFAKAKGDIIITLDADLQNPPEEIPKLLSKLDEGYEIVFGVPIMKQHSWFRRLGSRFSKWVLSKIVQTPNVGFSGFRVIKSDVIKQLRTLKEKGKFIDGLICWMGYKVTSVEVEHHVRKSGKSKYNLLKLVRLWLDMVVSFTNIPLRLAIFGGLALGIIAFILVIVYVVLYFTMSYTLPGFITTTLLISFFAGVQLFCLGIIGEYIGRINYEVKNKPEYIIRETYEAN